MTDPAASRLTTPHGRYVVIRGRLWDEDGFTGRIVANTDYALPLEVGTEDIAARRFLSRVVTDHGDDLRQAFVAGAKD